MNVMVFDTETTNLEKPFSYNIGYTIVNVETGEKLVNRDFVVEQIWHNLMLFTTAYYADKRSLYVSKMKAKRTIMDKFGYITQQIIRDIKSYEIAAGYAYNSPFDIKVFAFCCDWFKVANPLDLIPVYDIRGYAVEFICNTDEYKAYCENNQKFTESGNYSTTAEAVYDLFLHFLPGFIVVRTHDNAVKLFKPVPALFDPVEVSAAERDGNSVGEARLNCG